VVSVFPIIGRELVIWLSKPAWPAANVDWSFVGMTAALTVLACSCRFRRAGDSDVHGTPTWPEGTGSTLEYLYPNELFPTDLRATGVGFAVAASRIGLRCKTFAFPLLLADAGAASGSCLPVVSARGLADGSQDGPRDTALTLDESSKPPVRRGASDRLDQPTRQPEPEIR